MWVKICGNTRLDDARLAASLGADAIGFIFAPGSKRLVTSQQVRKMNDALAEEFPHVERVGVFTQPDAREIEGIARSANLNALQLHGDSAQACAPVLRDAFPGLKIYAALAWAGEDALLSRGAAFPFDALFVDSPSARHLGGTGQSFDWHQAAPTFARAAQQGIRVVAAGGLAPGNVAEVITVLAPFGVDVASGTESSPGVKDHAKLRAFLAAARQPVR